MSRALSSLLVPGLGARAAGAAVGRFATDAATSTRESDQIWRVLKGVATYGNARLNSAVSCRRTPPPQCCVAMSSLMLRVDSVALRAGRCP